MKTKQAITACLCLLFWAGQGMAQVEASIEGWSTGTGIIWTSDGIRTNITMTDNLPDIPISTVPPMIDREVHWSPGLYSHIDKAEEEFKAAVERMNNQTKGSQSDVQDT